MKNQILFVDDEPHILDGLKRLISDQRKVWNMTFAVGVDAALSKINECEFDVIVSDITMPGKDGFYLLKTIRETPKTKDIPVVILTGLNDTETKKRALDSGATDLLNKPVDREELLARIRNSIRLKSYLDQIKSNNEKLEKTVKERTKDLMKSRLDLILRMGQIYEYRNRDMGSHGIKVACYARVISENLGLEKKLIDKIFIATPLHDIGLIKVPDSILLKKEILTFEEWDLLREHSKLGEEIIAKKIEGISSFYSIGGLGVGYDFDPKSNPLLSMASNIALTHHEWWNGKGYPNGLSKKDIPFESRIVALADAYDELTSKRPYRDAIPEDVALDKIRKSIGVQFDPEIYTGFDKSIEQLSSIRKKFLEEEKGEVKSDG